jgi:hypothetical protein
MKQIKSTPQPNPYIPPYLDQLEDASQVKSWFEIEQNTIKFLLALVLVYQFGFFSTVWIFLGALALSYFVQKKKR